MLHRGTRPAGLPCLDPIQELSHRGPLTSVYLLLSVFRQRSLECVRIPAFEEDKVLILTLDLLDGVIDAIFPGDSFKAPDASVMHLDACYALSLRNQFLDGLFSVGGDILLLRLLLDGLTILDVFVYLGDCLGKYTTREFGCVHRYGDGSHFDIFLRGYSSFQR